MFTAIIAKLLRLLSNQKKKHLYSPAASKNEKNVVVETSVQRTNLSLYYPLESKTRKAPCLHQLPWWSVHNE
ncbi:hypothetical protein [Cytobacillus horneckiae]|uniref:hypothetical protein n=1 Tax=Cytobacillus horneckiae TaxID=549687 RepID=UPI003D9AB236